LCDINYLSHYIRDMTHYLYNREASDSIEKIIKYCKNPPDNFNIKMEES